MIYKSTVQVVQELKGRGYEVNLGFVSWILRERIIAAPEKGPGGSFLWDTPDIERLESELRRRGRGPVGAGNGHATTAR